MSDNLIQLPNGDLWRAPVRDENGNNVERPSTVDISNLPQRASMTPDVAAILMNDLQRQTDAAKAAAAAKA